MKLYQRIASKMDARIGSAYRGLPVGNRKHLGA